jgi:hypothetical protein
MRHGAGRLSFVAVEVCGLPPFHMKPWKGRAPISVLNSVRTREHGHWWFPILVAMKLRQGWGTHFCGLIRVGHSSPISSGGSEAGPAKLAAQATREAGGAFLRLYQVRSA